MSTTFVEPDPCLKAAVSEYAIQRLRHIVLLVYISMQMEVKTMNGSHAGTAGTHMSNDQNANPFPAQQPRAMFTIKRKGPTTAIT